jgi:release factor glutamine methyltransferase
MVAAVTVLEVIQRSTDFLTRKGVDSPRLQVELLLAHVLRLPRLHLYLNFERSLNLHEIDALRELIRRRGDREPLQHLVGSTSFCGLGLRVTREVLVPRPETEALAEQAWKLLGGLGAAAPEVLDLGTGSGCLAITLAVKCPGARIHAVDLAEAALEVARENARHHAVLDRIGFHRSDAFAALPPGLRFDLIVANPPYIPRAEIATLMPEVRDHDPRLALDGGEDGLDFFRRLAVEAGSWLRPAGRMLLEFGDGQEPALRSVFAGHNWIVERVEADYSGQPRILVVTLANSTAP